MSRRNLIILGGVFGVLLIYVLLTQTGNRGFSTLSLPALPKIDSADMETIQMTRAGGTLVLGQLKDQSWRIQKPLDFPADKNRVENARRVLSELKITDFIAERPTADKDYGLNTGTALGVTVKGKKGQALALTVGKTNRGYTHTFVQVPQNPKVYQVLGDITQALRGEPGEWRSLQIFDSSPDGARAVAITQHEKTVTLEKMQENPAETVASKGVTPAAQTAIMVWKAQGQKLNDVKVNQLLGSLTRLAGIRISDDARPAIAPLGRIAFTLLDGEHALEILEFKKATKEYLVRRAGDKTIYVLSDYQGQNLLKTAGDLK